MYSTKSLAMAHKATETAATLTGNIKRFKSPQRRQMTSSSTGTPNVTHRLR